MAEREYHRLTPARPRRWSAESMFGNPFSTRSSLWIARDHLLNVDSNRYTESYKRFYFQDIQAIIVRKNGRRSFWNSLLLVLIVFYFGAFLYFNGRTIDADAIPALILGVGFLVVPFILNNLMGATCTCTLQTAVQKEDLPSLNRMPRVNRVLARVRPLIAAAQGQLSREEIAAGVTRLEVSNAPRPAAPPALVVSLEAPPPPEAPAATP